MTQLLLYILLQLISVQFMTLRRLNIRIQGFPESYATEPYMAESMVVGEPATSSPHPHHHLHASHSPPQQLMDGLSRTPTVMSHPHHKQQPPEPMAEQRMADTTMHDDEARSNTPSIRDAAVEDGVNDTLRIEAGTV
jgi:hypothetical protein